MISRLPQGFSARCLRFTNAVAAARAGLASGWRAPPLPGRASNPLGRFERFQVHRSPDASGSHVRRRFYELAVGDRLTVLIGGKLQAMAQKLDDAGLDRRLGKDGDDGFRKPSSPV